MSGPEKPWTIAMGDGFSFNIVPEQTRYQGFGSNGDLNGLFATKADALDQVVRDLERTRNALARQIARAKRMRRAARTALTDTGDRG